MASKQGYSPELKNYLDKRLEIRLNGNRVLKGRLRGYDQFMNLILEECIEIVKKEKNNKIEIENNEIGSVMIRGNTVILWECIEKISNK